MTYEPHEEWMELLAEASEGGAWTADPACGIAKQVVGKGVDSLNPIQRRIFDREIWPTLRPMQIARDRERNIERVLSE